MEASALTEEGRGTPLHLLPAAPGPGHICAHGCTHSCCANPAVALASRTHAHTCTPQSTPHSLGQGFSEAPWVPTEGARGCSWHRGAKRPGVLGSRRRLKCLQLFPMPQQPDDVTRESLDAGHPRTRESLRGAEDRNPAERHVPGVGRGSGRRVPLPIAGDATYRWVLTRLLPREARPRPITRRRPGGAAGRLAAAERAPRHPTPRMRGAAPHRGRP